MGAPPAGLLALLVTGFAAFILRLLDPQFDFTIFTLLFQGIAYLCLIGVANLFYSLGPALDLALNPSNCDQFRKRLFGLGLIFSVALPLALPALVLAARLHYPAAGLTEADVVGTWKSIRSFKGSLIGSDEILLRADGTFEHTFCDTLCSETKGTWHLSNDERGSTLSFQSFVWGFDDLFHASNQPAPWIVPIDRGITGHLRIYYNSATGLYFEK